MGKKTYLIIALIVAVVSIAMQRKSLIQKEQQKVLVDYEIDQVDTARYKNDWQKISALIDSGLPKSALISLDVMMEKAIQDSNYYEVVKIVQFRLAANNQHQEHFVDSSLQYLQTQSERLPSPAAEYVQLLACDLLKNHINWRHPENGVPAINESYQSWSVAFIHDSIIKCQKRLLPLIEQTKKMPHAAFEKIKSPNNQLYPTLYDLFIWKMISQHDHYRFKTEIVKSSEKLFAIATGDEFSRAENQLKDWPFVVYLHHLLENFHCNKKPQTAFVNAKIQRIQWIKKHQIIPLSEENYAALMEKLWHIHPNNLLTPSIIYELAITQYKQLSRKNKNHDFKAVLARANKGLELTKKMIANKFDSLALKEVSKAFESLIMEIKKLDFSVEIEEFNLPNEPIAARITFQNLAQEHEDHLVYFNVYEYVDKKDFGPKEYLKEGNLVASFEKQLFDKKAYHSWSTYLKIPGLKVGKYMLIADPKQKFDGTETVNSIFTVTQLTAITQQINQNSFKVEVLDRKTGFPVPNCQVTYHYNKSHNENRKITQRSNEKGEVVFQYKSRYSWRNRGLDLVLGKDQIHVDHYLSQQVGSARESDVSQIFIDRSLYRPGQTLFFKAVSTHQQTLPFSNKPVITLNKKKKLTIQLYDANYELVWDSVMTTNQFGSVAGSVKLDQNRMTGSWRLRIENSDSYFNVEEYKRPTFEASFKKISKEYQFGDSISVTGIATSFSGVPVRNAKVQITVSKKVNHYLHPRHDKSYYWGIPQPTTADQIVVSKTTNTNSKGQYTITFYAKKEPQFDYQNQYISYSINSSITNLTGETRTANTNISVGTQGFQINANIPEQIDKNGHEQGIVRAVNLNGIDTTSKI